jgi:thiol-disulfide isomerase/thioredoxin
MDFSKKLYFPAAIMILAILLTMPAASFALPKKGQPAPPLQVVTTAGQKLSMANYKGYVLVLEFFATYCGGCKESIPHLLNLNKQYGNKGLQILALDIGQGDTPEDVKEFVARKKINYPVAMADESIIYDGYGIRMIPSIFIINKKGILVEKFDGFTDETRKIIETTVKKLIAE